MVCSGTMWESRVLLTYGQVVFPGISGFRPPLMNDWLDISKIFLKGPQNPKKKKKKKKKKHFGFDITREYNLFVAVAG